jgi:hypothetical protein
MSVLFEKRLRVLVPEDVWATTSDAEMECLLDAIRTDQLLQSAFDEIQRRLAVLVQPIRGVVDWE